MYVSDLSLDDFCSYRSLALSLEPGPSTFVGSNGQGKINLVEATVYLTTLSSHRIGADTALVRRAASGQAQSTGAVMCVRAVHGERPSVLETEIIVGKASRARLNRGGCRSRDLLGVLRAVVFAPKDPSLMHAKPGVHRGLLDDLVVTLRSDLAGVCVEHDKILVRHASLLKSTRVVRSSISSVPSTLGVWDAQLTAAAARLITARVDVVRRLRPWAASAYETASGTFGQRSCAQLAYCSSLLIHEGHPEPDPHDESAWPTGEEALLDEAVPVARLESATGELHAREIDHDANLVGAHRDDLNLFLTGPSARGFTSHGEQ